MKRFAFESLLFLALACIFFAWVFGQLPDYSSGNARKYIGIDYFKTFTVEVDFQNFSSGEIFGLKEDQLAEVILMRMRNDVQTKFPNKGILSSAYAQPYSFESNPLNLAILFTVRKGNEKEPFFIIGPTFSRSNLYTLYKNQTRDSSQLKKYNEFVVSGKDFLKPIHNYEPIPNSFDRVHVYDRSQLESRIERLSLDIVNEMDPRENEAAEVELELIAKRQLKK